MTNNSDNYVDGLELRIKELEAACDATCYARDQAYVRINELEATIKSHGIPVKSYCGGVAHYCTGVALDTGVVYWKEEA
jgi:hypothetical protein